jgi:sec-independent protein translocase protein TatB
LGIVEIIVILAVALIVIPPENLPDVMRAAGKILRELRLASNMVMRELGGVLDQPSDSQPVPPINTMKSTVIATGANIAQSAVSANSKASADPVAPANSVTPGNLGNTPVPAAAPPEPMADSAAAPSTLASAAPDATPAGLAAAPAGPKAAPAGPKAID